LYTKIKCILLVYGTIKITMDPSSNFSMADIVLLNKLYWLLSFITFVMLTSFCYFVEFVSL